MLSRICYMLLFIFFKQKTAYEMRISDWSSDVCSSDLRRSEGSGSEAPWKTVTAADKSWPPSSVQSPGRSRAVTPPVDAAEQEQPHHVDEMPVPGRRLEAEMMVRRSEEHTSELQSLMRISYAVFCLKKKKQQHHHHQPHDIRSTTNNQ